MQEHMRLYEYGTLLEERTAPAVIALLRFSFGLRTLVPLLPPVYSQPGNVMRSVHTSYSTCRKQY
jgi:hypothetical protein